VFLPAKVSVLLSICWLTFIFIAFSDAATNILVTACVCLALLIWGASLLVRAILLLVLTRSSRWRYEHRGAEIEQSWGWTIEILVLLLSVILLSCQIPFIIRLKLSETALTEYIQAVKYGSRSLTSTAYPLRWVGLFRVKETELLDGGIVRMITTDAFLDDAGFVYSPNRQPPIQGEDSYRHLYGDWWYWHRSW
jgi:hypothetical protein